MSPTLKKLRKVFLETEARLILKFGRVERYQPIPSLGITDSQRGQSSWERWRAIERELGEVTGCAIDIGCNSGFFTFQLAQLGYVAMGIESDGGYYQLCNLLKDINNFYQTAFLKMALDSINCDKLPAVDVIVFLSVFHHMVRIEGLENATQMLRCLLRKTRRVLFFEMGQSNEPNVSWSKSLPDMGANPRLWLEEYLTTLGASRVVHLGDYGTHLSDVKRALFAVYP